MLGDGQTERMEKTLKPWKTLLVNLDDGLRFKNKEITLLLTVLSMMMTLLVWLYQPPLLSSMSFCGIIFVVGEQVIPWSLKAIYGDSGEKMWNADKTIKYKKICQELTFYRALINSAGNIPRPEMFIFVLKKILLDLSALYKDQIQSVYEWFGQQKKESPGVYLVVVTCVLTVLTYITNKISNVWLMYITTILVFAARAFWLEKQQGMKYTAPVDKSD